MTEQEPRDKRPLTPCGNIVCTGCRICGCPALGIAPQEARDDEREALDYVVALNEHAEEQFGRGVESAHGYDEASFLAGVRWAHDRKHPEPEITDETGNLIEKARAVFDPYEGKGSPMLLGWIDALADALERKQSAPEMEYEVSYSSANAPSVDGYALRRTSGVMTDLGKAREFAASVRNPVLRARTKGVPAGPWVPVGEKEQTTAAPVVSARIPGDELRVDSPSYSVRRLLSEVDGIESSDGEFSIATDHVDAGGTITIRDSQGFPLYELNLQGNPTNDEEMDG